MKPYVRIGLLLAVIASAGAVVPHIVASREQVHEIRLVAKNMTYYANGNQDPNPPLRLVPGEQVRVIFRNDDRGMSHDFGIPTFGVDGRYLLRACIVNFNTREADVDALADLAVRLGREVDAELRPAAAR